MKNGHYTVMGIFFTYDNVDVTVNDRASRVCPGLSAVIIIHFLGLAPEGWLAAPDKRPVGHPIPSVSLNPLTHRTIGKPPRTKKIATQVLGGRRFAPHVPVDPEPTADRKPPAPLALFTFLTGPNSLEALWSRVILVPLINRHLRGAVPKRSVYAFLARSTLPIHALLERLVLPELL
jgi:hypothetical protein